MDTPQGTDPLLPATFPIPRSSSGVLPIPSRNTILSTESIPSSIIMPQNYTEVSAIARERRAANIAGALYLPETVVTRTLSDRMGHVPEDFRPLSAREATAWTYPEEAEELARRISEIAKPGELIICPHEPFTGAHVGPGMLAVFFMGRER